VRSAALRLAVVVTFLLGCTLAHAQSKSAGATRLRPDRTMRVSATAYCDSGTTKAGVPARSGMIAADPRVLPLGTVVRILDPGFRGTYVVMDTGSEIKGRDIDIFMASCQHAKRFGRKTMSVEVVWLSAPAR
jgi:3D (Asp-Asp-Asp) domain-containing protein